MPDLHWSLPATSEAGGDPALEAKHGGANGSSLRRERWDLHGGIAAFEVLDAPQRASVGNGDGYLRRRESTPFGSEPSDCF